MTPAAPLLCSQCLRGWQDETPATTITAGEAVCLFHLPDSTGRIPQRRRSSDTEAPGETITVPLADLLLVIGDARSNPYSEEAEACARIEALIPPDNAEKRPRS